MTDMKPVRLAVRKVVERVMLCGDIDSRYADPSAMLEGARAHRKLQAAMGEGYQKEVSLRLDVELADIPVILHGRADGVLEDAETGLVIEEIKTTTLPLDSLAAQREQHLGQAKCYAHMLLQKLEAPPPQVTIQLTYFQLETERVERQGFSFTADELKAFFEGLMEAYSVWLRFERDWKPLRNASIKALGFPFDAYRAGQRNLAAAVYGTIINAKKLYAQAPTGIGKTLSTLFPSIKAIGEEKAEKLFYLTAKTVTRAVAEDAVALMAQKGLRFKSLTLRAKEKICFCGEAVCTPEACPYARGHYDRVNAALLDLLEHADLVTPEVAEAYAKKHSVCPYEFSLDAAEWMDLVVCDYNHVFDPTVYLRRFFSDADGDYVFLIDEAHNLCDRVRDMYSAQLRRSPFSRLKKELKDKTAAAKRLRKALGQVGDYLQGLRKELGESAHFVSGTLDAALVSLAERFSLAAKDWLALEQHNTHALHGDVLELYFEAQSFLGIADGYGEHYASITEAPGSDVAATLFCLDPSGIIRERLKLAKASVLFSATLTPLPYYRDILGGEETDYIAALPSPFDESNLLLAAHYGISTKYADRKASVSRLAETIHLAIKKKTGNYLVYFPSYEYMRDVYEAFSAGYPCVHTILQQASMDEPARAAFLNRFDTGNTETLLGFCVLGGIFSEGIDLKGERLIGALVVGVGLPKLSLRQNLIRDYFDKVNGEGYDYAYVFPGMNKVLQAAGRVIRSETDRGVVLLIDSRFNTAKYRGLYPPHWRGMRMLKSTGEFEQLIEGFWGDQGERGNSIDGAPH